MTDDEFTEIMQSIREDMKTIGVAVDSLALDNKRLVRENNLLRARIDELAPPPLDYTDDMADAAHDREREADWQRSTDRYARGERE